MNGTLHDQPARTGSARAVTAGGETVQSILNTALIAEQLAIAFYYTALTTPALMHDPRLGGSSADPNNPGLPPDGYPSNVRYLQAALDAEVKHAAALANAGATSPYRHVYFPATTFKAMGLLTDAASFLGVLDTLEVAFVTAYTTAVGQFLRLGRVDLATVAAQIAGVEAEHRATGRLIARVAPANNLTLEQAPVATVGAAGAALSPFLSGKGLPGPAAMRVALPTPAQTARVIGKYDTRIVVTFL